MAAHAHALALAGRHADAVQMLARAVALSEQHLGPAHPVTATRRSLLTAWRGDGTADLAEVGRQLAADQPHADAVATGPAAASSACRAALAKRQPSAACAQAVERGGGLSQDVLYLGHSQLLAGDADDARRHYLQVARTVELEDVFRRDVLGSFDVVFEGTAHAAEARRLKALTEERWQAVMRARADYQLAKAHGEARRHNEALAPALRAYEVLDEAGPPAADVGLLDPMLGEMALGEYMVALEQTRRFDATLSFVDRRLAASRPLTPNARHLLMTSRAGALEDLGHDIAAEQAWRAAITAGQADPEPDLDHLLSQHISLARLQFAMGRFDDAARTLDTARPLTELQSRSGLTFYAEELALQQARVWAATGEPAKAAPLAERMIAVDSAHRDAGHKALAQSVLAEVRSAQGRHEEALVLHTESLNVLQQRLGEGHLVTITQMESLATAQVKAGRRQEALATMARAVALTQQALGPQHPRSLARQARLAGWRAS